MSIRDHLGNVIAGSGGGATADDTAYGASWDGNQDAPTKNVIYDKLEADKISNNSQWYCYQDTGQEQTMSTTAFFNNYMNYPTFENNPNNQLTTVTDANGTYTKFTPTRAGIYAVESGIDLQNATYASGDSVQMVLAVKGVLVGKFGLQPSQAAGTYFCYIGGNQFVYLDPSLSDFVTIHTYLSKTGAAAVSASGKFATFMRITQLGF